MKRMLLIAALLATALAACKRVDEPAPGTSAAPVAAKPAAPTVVRVPVYRGSDVEKKGQVTRFIDGDAGVLCYHGVYESNPSCVPLSHTTLRPDGSSRYPAE
jgi:hypothetical protein